MSADPVAPNAGPRLLVLGGTRSGKSTHALEWARAHAGADVTFIATARPGDPDLDARIAGHIAHRPPGWRTIESGLDLPGAIRNAPGANRPEAILLVDCLTLWVSALLEAERPVAEAWGELSGAIGGVRAPIVIVSDEVGHGVVPVSELGRRFRDDLGWLNQRVAGVAQEVVLLVAGIALTIKPLAASAWPQPHKPGPDT
jgi:adenosylcobinamide kinase/adenosylcobinamide-phosphate guanylyltransferase